LAFVQHARAFRRGAIIVASHDANGDAPAVNAALIGQPSIIVNRNSDAGIARPPRVYISGAKKFDGSLVLVLTNPGDAKDVTVGCAGQTAKIPLTADSTTTLRWS